MVLLAIGMAGSSSCASKLARRTPADEESEAITEAPLRHDPSSIKEQTKSAGLKFSGGKVPRRVATPSIVGDTLHWPLSMGRAMEEVDPTLHPWESKHYEVPINDSYDYSSFSTPFAALGDFDGNGELDAALHGRDRARELIFVLLSRGEAATFYKVEGHPLPYPDDWPLTPGLFKHGLSRYLELIPKGKPISPGGQVLDRDAFAVVDGDGSKVYLFSDGQFRRHPSTEEEGANPGKGF